MQCPIIMLLACISQWEKRIPKFRTILYVLVPEGTNYYRKISRKGEKSHKPATQLIHEKSNPCHINEVNRSKKDWRLEEQVKRRVNCLRKVFDYNRSALLKQSTTWLESFLKAANVKAFKVLYRTFLAKWLSVISDTFWRYSWRNTPWPVLIYIHNFDLNSWKQPISRFFWNKQEFNISGSFRENKDQKSFIN